MARLPLPLHFNLIPAVGFAAALCKKYDVNPRELYTGYLDEYLALIESQKFEKIPESKK